MYTVTFQDYPERNYMEDFDSVDAACNWAESTYDAGDRYAVVDEQNRTIPGCEYVIPDKEATL